MHSFNRELSPAALTSVREVVGARARAVGNFPDNFGHEELR